MPQDRMMITGSGGLVGSEAALYFGRKGWKILGVDNDGRRQFFGDEASVASRIDELLGQTGFKYRHCTNSIEDADYTRMIMAEFRPDVIIHTAAQPSHDWAAENPDKDFSVNAAGTMNVLEAARLYVPGCVFIYTSTNKVYGDNPNSMIPVDERSTRWEPYTHHRWYNGITEDMSIDATTHSVFGVSKTAADLMVQEYGRYFGMKTVCFRCGCITGPAHRGAELHGFLSYLAKCVKHDIPYTIFGYKGKQVRDNIHASDLVTAFEAYMRWPRAGEVYNIGGGRDNSCSVLEAIDSIERILGKRLKYDISSTPRMGDHRWWITSNYKFQQDYPRWEQKYNLHEILEEICNAV